MTKTGASLLDPTSQHPHLYASQHMTAQDWKFGLALGRDPDVIDMMAERYPGKRTQPTHRVKSLECSCEMCCECRRESACGIWRERGTREVWCEIESAVREAES